MLETSYSEAEMTLFKSLGSDHLVKHLTPPPLYRVMVEWAFIENMQGPHIEALRRGARSVLSSGKPCRMTKEFDELIKFES